MPYRFGAGRVHHIFTGPHQFHDHQRQIGKTQRVGAALLGQKVFQRQRIGLGRQDFAFVAGHVDDALPAFGRTHHASQRATAMRLQETRRTSVGSDHELFD